MHTISTWSRAGQRRYLCAKIKCRCTRTCWHPRTAGCCRAKEGGGGGSEVLINIFSGIRSEIKLTARICESFVTGYPCPPFLSRFLARYLRDSLVLAFTSRLRKPWFARSPRFSRCNDVGDFSSSRNNLNLRGWFSQIRIVKTLKNNVLKKNSGLFNFSSTFTSYIYLYIFYYSFF